MDYQSVDIAFQNALQSLLGVGFICIRKDVV